MGLRQGQEIQFRMSLVLAQAKIPSQGLIMSALLITMGHPQIGPQVRLLHQAIDPKKEAPLKKVKKRKRIG